MTSIVVDRRIVVSASNGDSYSAPGNQGNLGQGPHHQHQMTIGAPANQPSAQDIAVAIVTLVRSQAASGALWDASQAVASAQELESVVAAPEAVPGQRERFHQAAARLLAAVGTTSASAATVNSLIENIRHTVGW
ncbi:hypothetical protein ACH47Z_39440 [Streptomyces sp. NPDC020192]|uniref:hypothetical protein n=1 Tax=Streptomyces sp. NPDC020192 TaxID=3365066 RepID=UPI0037AA8E01